MKINWKWLVLIITVLVIVAAVLAWFEARYYQARTRDISGWQVYQSDGLGFEIKYPKDWKTREKKNGNARLVSFYSLSMNRDDIFGKNLLPVEIVINENTDGLPINEFIKKEVSDNLISKKIENFSVNNLNGVKIFYLAEKSDLSDKQEKIEAVYFSNNNKIYSISAVDGSAYFSRMLSTFKFIERADTLNWQIYRNDEYGFEIKYPGGPDWDLVKTGTVAIKKQILMEIGDGNCFIAVHVEKNENQLGVEDFCRNIYKDYDWVDENVSYYSDPCLHVLHKNYIVKDLTGYQSFFIKRVGGAWDTMATMISANKLVYTIERSASPEDNY
jgi:hypothetical protein